MVRKFECFNCGHSFQADDSEYVRCPQCQSDNIDIYKRRLPKGVKMLLAGLPLVCAVAGGGWWYWSTRPVAETPVVEVTEEQTEEEIQTALDVIDETGMSIPASISVEGPNLAGEAYEVKAKLQNAPRCKYRFRLLDAYDDNKVIAECENGAFSNVPFSEAEGGSYRLQAVSLANDSVLATLDVVGFIRQVKVSKKMSVAELQQLIEARDKSLLGVGENDYLAPDYKLTVKGLSADAVKPKVLSEVFDKLNNEVWESATVSALDYDNMNRISGITLTVVEMDLDF